MSGMAYTRLVLTSAVVYIILISQIESYPLTRQNSEDEKVEVKYPANTKEPANVEETVKNILGEIDDLQVKALYQRKVTLERLVNGTDIPASSLLPKYVVTQEDKVYFFTEPTNNTSSMLSVESDAPKRQITPKSASGPANQEDDNEGPQAILQRLLTLVKKHTGNSLPTTRLSTPKAVNEDETLSASDSQAREYSMMAEDSDSDVVQKFLTLARRHTGNHPWTGLRKKTEKRVEANNQDTLSSASSPAGQQSSVMVHNEPGMGRESSVIVHNGPASPNYPNIEELLRLKIILQHFLDPIVNSNVK